LVRQWRRTARNNELHSTIGRVQAIENLATTIARLTDGGRPVWRSRRVNTARLQQQ
jgi:hypothetical protein